MEADKKPFYARLVEEKVQVWDFMYDTDLREKKLAEFINKESFLELPEKQQKALLLQWDYMKNTLMYLDRYYKILQKRIKLLEEEENGCDAT